MPHAYCTYFDSGYLSRGLALIESLRAHGDDSDVWIMALDDDVRAYLAHAAIPGVHVLTVADLEATVDGLAPLRETRSRMEYYFTCTPLLVRHVMNGYRQPTAVVYLDADLWFFDDPGLVFAAMGEGSIGIIEHRYPDALARKLAKYGRFNVGWVGFRADDRGRACLDWWSARTLEWCSDVPQDGKYADQGYLDWFPREFEGVSVLQPKGLNLAPWNTANYRIESTGPNVRVDDDPLVFFHFHGLKRAGNWWVTAQLVYGARLGRVLRHQVYTPYLRAIERLDALVAASPLVHSRAVARRGKGLRGLLFRVQKTAVTVASVATGSALKARGQTS